MCGFASGVPMIRLGLASSAFPAKSPQEIMKLALDAGLEGVEWAAESHLRPGDKAVAQSLMMETLLARLSIVSYAALYRVRPGHESGLAFDTILDTAAMLQAPILRIFAGQLPYAKESAEGRASLLEELRRLGDRSGERGITICLSFGRGTCLEAYEAAAALFADLDHAFVRLAWEPIPGRKAEEATLAVESLTARTALLLARKSDSLGRAGLLSEEAACWSRRMDAFRAGETAPKMSRFILLGRIGEEDETRLRDDATFLRALAKEKNAKKP